jgi:hypothetical protein
MTERKSLIERFGGTVEPKAPQSKQFRSVDDSFPDKGHVTGGTVMPSGRAIVQRTGSVDSRPRKEIKLDKKNPAHIKALLSDKDALVHAGGKVTMPDVSKKKLEKKSAPKTVAPVKKVSNLQKAQQKLEAAKKEGKL